MDKDHAAAELPIEHEDGFERVRDDRHAGGVVKQPPRDHGESLDHIRGRLHGFDFPVAGPQGRYHQTYDQQTRTETHPRTNHAIFSFWAMGRWGWDVSPGGMTC